MSESTAAATRKEPGMAMLVIVLLVICLVTSLLLGLANAVTAPAILANETAKREAAMAAVLAADSYTPVEYTGSDSSISGVYQAGDLGYVVEVNCVGSFSGTLSIMVGVDASGAITGVEVVQNAETSGLGANVNKAAWREQFKGQTGKLAVTKDGGTINAVTGATVTSRSVSNGVNSAMAAAASMG